MRKNLSWALAAAVLLCIAGCGSESETGAIDKRPSGKTNGEKPAQVADGGGAAKLEDGGAETPKQEKSLDVSFIPEDCFCAIIIHPKRIADSPLANELSEDVTEELLREMTRGLGIDLRKVEQRVRLSILDDSIVDLSDSQASLGHGEICRFAEPIVDRELLGKMFRDVGFVEERSVAGKKYHAGWYDAGGGGAQQETYEADRPPDVAAHFPDDRSVVYSYQEPFLRKMLAAGNVKSDLVERLRQLDSESDLVIAAATKPPDVSVERIAREVGPMPLEMIGLLNNPSSFRAATLTADLREDPVAKLVVEATDADSAAKLKEFVDGALTAGKSSFSGNRDEFAEGFPPGVGLWVVELVEQSIGGIVVAQDGARVTATLKRPEALARLPEILTTIADTENDQQRGFKRDMPGPREVAVTVVYEVDAANRPAGFKPSDAQLRQLQMVIERRLNPPGRVSGHVLLIGDGRIEVSIFDDDASSVFRTIKLLPRPGTLAFRILANPHDHKRLIERAQNEVGPNLTDERGITVASWVPVANGKEGNFRSYIEQNEAVSRTTDNGNGKVLEILVVADEYDVTGSHLKTVEVTADSHTGDPCIAFQLDGAGAELFSKLTSENCPDEEQGIYRQLGIIIDGQLQSAPVIRSAIHDRAQISGFDNVMEVHDLVDLLDSGALPLTIREVGRRVPEADTVPNS